MKFNFNEFYEHNFGDFVHIHALCEWFRGTPSLESFLKSKDDKAIVKDMHFTDERTTVDYIDTKDDTEKSETLCEYLTSDVSDETNSGIFKKVDKIKFCKNKFNEPFISVREKDTKKERDNFIRSNIPVAYDATDDYQTSDKTYHIGITENGVNIYDDDTLELVKEYDYTRGTIMPVSVNDMPLFDCNPFGRCLNLANYSPINITKETDFFATKIGGKVVSGQVVYHFIDEVTVSAGKSVTLQLQPATMGSSNFSQNVYPKYARCQADNMNNNAGLISSLHYDSQGGFPTGNTSPIRLTVFNPNETDITLGYVLFTF